jgi:hypothetical protein
VFRAICEKADLRHPSPHDMRHTFGTLSLLEGAPLAYVSKNLGHADKAITLRVYTHSLPDTAVEQHEAARLDLRRKKLQTSRKLGGSSKQPAGDFLSKSGEPRRSRTGSAALFNLLMACDFWSQLLLVHSGRSFLDSTDYLATRPEWTRVVETFWKRQRKPARCRLKQVFARRR